MACVVWCGNWFCCFFGCSPRLYAGYVCLIGFLQAMVGCGQLDLAPPRSHDILPDCGGIAWAIALCAALAWASYGLWAVTWGGCLALSLLQISMLSGISTEARFLLLSFLVVGRG